VSDVVVVVVVVMVVVVVVFSDAAAVIVTTWRSSVVLLVFVLVLCVSFVFVFGKAVFLPCVLKKVVCLPDRRRPVAEGMGALSKPLPKQSFRQQAVKFGTPMSSLLLLQSKIGLP